MGLHAFDPTHFGRAGGGEHPRLLDFTIVTPAATDPVTLAELKEWLRVDGTDQDDLITSLISSATEWAENYTHRAFVERDLDVDFAHFPHVGQDLYLPSPPLRVLTAVTYVDSAGVAQVYDVADLDIFPSTGLVRVKPTAVEDWPQGVFGVECLYTAGFGPTAAETPEEVKTAIKVAVTQNFLFRGDQIAGSQFSTAQLKSSMSLLNHHRVFLQ